MIPQKSSKFDQYQNKVLEIRQQIFLTSYYLQVEYAFQAPKKTRPQHNFSSKTDSLIVAKCGDLLEVFQALNHNIKQPIKQKVL